MAKILYFAGTLAIGLGIAISWGDAGAGIGAVGLSLIFAAIACAIAGDV